jgi:hypothetical protein
VEKYVFCVLACLLGMSLTQVKPLSKINPEIISISSWIIALLLAKRGSK